MEITKKVRELIKATKMHPKASEQDLDLFLHFAEKAGLDPLSNQINAVFRYDKEAKRHRMSVQVGIDGYRLIADRTSVYAGSDDYLFDDGLTVFQHMSENRGHPLTATCTIYKIVRNHRVPFSATADWKSYCPPGNAGFMWDKMPYLMLGKCAESLALRKGFPQELSGLYTEEEMAQSNDEPLVEISPKSPPSDTTPMEITDQKIDDAPAKETDDTAITDRPFSPDHLRTVLIKGANAKSKELRELAGMPTTSKIVAALIQRAYQDPPTNGQNVDERAKEVYSAIDKYHKFLHFIYGERAIGEDGISNKNLSQADLLTLLNWISGGKASFTATLEEHAVSEARLVWKAIENETSS